MLENLKVSLSTKQFEFIKKSTAKINIAHGSVRSGKTHSSLIRFAEAVLKCPDDNIIMIGKSAGSIYDNAVKPLALDDSAAFKGMCSWHPSNMGGAILNFCGKDIRVIGANDQSAVGRIQGRTISLAYVDEMTLLPQNFMDMLYSRLSNEWSKLIGTTNPDTPFHPLKKLIDEQDGKNVYALHFQLIDNPVLSDDYKKMLDQLYSGLWRRRFVLGEWCLAEGAIYDFFDRKFHVVDRPPTYAQYYIAGIDYGTSNPFAMVLLGVNETVAPSIWVEKEYYYDPKVMGRQKTDAEFAEDVDRALAGYPVRVIYLDPSAESLQVEFKKRRKPVRQAINDVRPGIGSVANYLCQGDLVICKEAENLIKEIESYTWDPKKVASGEDAPLKVRDHACFVEGTWVEGAGEIQNIKPGDYVFTRKGKKKVLECQDTGFANCYEYEIANRKICCTNDHPFFTVNSGWKKATDLLVSDILVTAKSEEVWENTGKGKRSSGKGKRTDDIQKLQQSLSDITLNVTEDISIEIFGKHPLEKYQKDTIFITSTKTPLIMIYPTSNVFLPSSMQRGIKKIVYGVFQTNVGRLLLSGIDQMRDESGIRCIHDELGLGNGKLKSMLVRTAAKIIQQRNIQELGFVRISVNLDGGEDLVLMMSFESALFVLSNILPTDTQKSSIALNPVPRKLLGGKRRVYNLKVDEMPEYFAEGILVHNCDALRYAVHTHFGNRMRIIKEAKKDPFENPPRPAYWGFTPVNQVFMPGR